MDFGFSSGVGSVISGTVSTASGFVSSTGLVNTSIYYKGTPISDEELACKEIIDHLHTDNPAWGARQMSAQLKSKYSGSIVRTKISDFVLTIEPL